MSEGLLEREKGRRKDEDGGETTGRWREEMRGGLRDHGH